MEKLGLPPKMTFKKGEVWPNPFDLIGELPFKVGGKYPVKHMGSVTQKCLRGW